MSPPSVIGKKPQCLPRALPHPPARFTSTPAPVPTGPPALSLQARLPKPARPLSMATPPQSLSVTAALCRPSSAIILLIPWPSSNIKPPETASRSARQGTAPTVQPEATGPPDTGHWLSGALGPLNAPQLGHLSAPPLPEHHALLSPRGVPCTARRQKTLRLGTSTSGSGTRQAVGKAHVTGPPLSLCRPPFQLPTGAFRVL